MKGLKGLKLGVIGIGAVALALIGGLILSAAVSAQGPEVAIHPPDAEGVPGTAAPGEDVAMDLMAHEIDAPGLGAWTIDITYDPDVVSVADCEPELGGVCNPDYLDAGDTIRVTGASATGHEGDTLLATITFTCGDAEDSSDLALGVEVLADATIGDPQDIDAEIENGSITCEEPPPPAATATTAPRVIGDVGSGGPSDGSGLGWLVAVLSAAGLAGIVGFGALRLRARKA